MVDIIFIIINAIQAVSMSEKQCNSIKSIINWDKKKKPTFTVVYTFPVSNNHPSSLLYKMQ